ncbi:ferredoxin [Streptomyces sp. AM 3-1-1]|uniref:ferredoxin n=1 Tax=unclassified Streptomyces TaxID=2593676 RepID=UPI0023BA322B|nr:ferredoxin [Streptomyces sp. AM 3-1-1]WEH31274.1 ferredoxin [Streptomyces sp. AM 3-1-1]
MSTPGGPRPRVEARTEVCVGAGQCVLAAPEVFDQDEEDGLVRLLDARPAAALLPSVREARHRCPSGAITLHDGTAH